MNKWELIYQEKIVTKTGWHCTHLFKVFESVVLFCHTLEKQTQPLSPECTDILLCTIRKRDASALQYLSHMLSSIPGIWWSLRPVCPSLGSVCSSGHWCHPSLHTDSCSGTDQSRTPSCTAVAVHLKLFLGTTCRGTFILRWIDRFLHFQIHQAGRIKWSIQGVKLMHDSLSGL